MNNKRGRPSRNYHTPAGDEIKGLYRRSDGRWVVKETGYTFTERDERLAVAKFRNLTERSTAVKLPGVLNVVPKPGWVTVKEPTADLSKYAARSSPASWSRTEVHGVLVESPGLWDYFREMLISRPVYVAQRTGLPKLANFADMDDPTRSPSIRAMLDSYCSNSGVRAATARKVRSTVTEFIRLTGCETLRDIETEKLIGYRDELKSSGATPDTLASYFQRIKVVIRFSRRDGHNSVEIRNALDKLEVLHVIRKRGAVLDPNPILPEQFSALLTGADPEMRAVLLLSLNCCLYLSEALSIEWDEINLSARTYSSRRGKTGVRRAATLWPETVDSIMALSRKAQSPYLFTSSHGKQYNVNSYRNKFNRLRDATKLSVEYNQIRDGSYTAACAFEVPFALCQFLAGHRLNGEADAYVARTPWKVKPACDAVYKSFAPFPASIGIAVKIGRPRKPGFAA